jgi:hypothetical protein
MFRSHELVHLKRNFFWFRHQIFIFDDQNAIEKRFGNNAEENEIIKNEFKFKISITNPPNEGLIIVDVCAIF